MKELCNIVYFKNHSLEEIEAKTDFSAGIDLICSEEAWIFPFCSKAIDLGISFELPSNTFGFITARSSTRLNKKLEVINGIIDSDYRGRIKAIFVNNTIIPRKVRRGDRLVQIIITSSPSIPYNTHLKEVSSIEKLSKTKRDTNGFGSTGGYKNK